MNSFTYTKWEKAATTLLTTVNFRNGTVAKFNNGVIKQSNFAGYTTAPPKGYFSFYTINNYADGTKEYVYADFYTITKGAPIPNPAPDAPLTNFNYQRIVNTGLEDSYENRTTGIKIANYKNQSSAIFTNGKFTSWITAPASIWVWCDKTDSTQYSELICTNATTLRFSKNIDESASDSERFRYHTYFSHMEIYPNGTSKSFYRNGSAAIFNSVGFVSWITPPEEYYVLKSVV